MIKGVITEVHEDYFVFLPEHGLDLKADFVPYLANGQIKVKYGKVAHTIKQINKIDPSFTKESLLNGKQVTLVYKKRYNHGKTSITLLAESIL